MAVVFISHTPALQVVVTASSCGCLAHDPRGTPRLEHCEKMRRWTKTRIDCISGFDGLGRRPVSVSKSADSGRDRCTAEVFMFVPGCMVRPAPLFDHLIGAKE